MRRRHESFWNISCISQIWAILWDASMTIFIKTGGYDDILYELRCDIDQMFQIEVKTYNSERKEVDTVEHMGKGMRSIYMLSLLETYIEGENRMPSIVIVEYRVVSPPAASEGIQRDFVPAVQEESGSVQHPPPPASFELHQPADPAGSIG